MKVDDQLHYRRNSRRIEGAVVERAAGDVLVDVPDLRTWALVDDAAESGARALQSDGRQPSPGNELIRAGDAGGKAFHDYRGAPREDLELKTIDGSLEPLADEESGLAVAPGDELTRQLDYLGRRKPAVRSERWSARAHAGSPTL
jgi:hypothetical protein